MPVPLRIWKLLTRRSLRLKRRLTKWFRNGSPIDYFFPASRQRSQQDFVSRRAIEKWRGVTIAQRPGGVIFLHIPKNGGTSVRHSLGKIDGFRELVPGKPLDTNRFIIVHQSIDWLVDNQILEAQKLSSSFVFALSRHPTTRAHSNYRYSKDKGFIPSSWSFLRYLKYVKREKPVIGGAKVARLSHAAPQSTWLNNDLWPGRVKVFQLENLHTLENRLKNELDTQISLGLLNASPGSMPILSAEERNMIWQLYRPDFERLGYEL